MRVFNLTELPLDFHGKVIKPNGGFVELPELDDFLPTRDLVLAKNGILSFGALPAGWQPPRPPEPAVEPPAPARAEVVVQETTTSEAELPRSMYEPTQAKKKQLPR